MSEHTDPVSSVRLDTPAIYFEDLGVGLSCESAGRTITEADIVAFAGLSGDYNSLHVDREFASNTSHGGRIAHGLLVLSILSGLSTRVPLMQGLSATIIGLSHLECRWKRATSIGDTLHVRLAVTELKPARKSDRGVVVLQRDAINQRDQTVLESIWSLVVYRRTGRPVA